MVSAKPEVLITKKFPENLIALLEEVAIVHQGEHTYELMKRDEVVRLIGRVSAVINQGELVVDRELLDEASNLKIVANVAAGFDNLDLEEMTRRSIWGTNTPGHFSYPVAEFIIGGVISVLRRLGEADRFVRENKWQSFQPGRWDGETLAGKTMGIIGTGIIGTALARLASAMGMQVVCYSRTGKNPSYLHLPVADILPRADVLSVNVPYSAETRALISAQEFSRMKPGAVFVNTSRGKVVCETDLIRFLQSGHLGGAVLDVFMEEPVVPEALKRMPNVLLTPHIAGGTGAGRLACYQLAVDNVKAVLKGESPVTPLNSIN